MGFKQNLGALSLLMSAASAYDISETAPRLTLIPVAVSKSGGVSTAARVATKKNLSLAWQTPNNDSAVTVDISMQHSAINLEDVEDIIGVDCTGQASVAVTFNNTEAFNEALSAWSGLNDSFVMITNHLGDCDAELERSFFVADSDTLASFETNLTIIAQAEKSDVHSTAKSTSIQFSSVATPNTDVTKRGLDWNEDGLTIAYNYSLPKDQTIVDTDYVTVKLNEVYVNNSVKYSGKTTWDLEHGVTEFWLEVDKTIFHYADMDVTIKAPWSDSFTWSPSVLSYAVIDVPGIISLGPGAGINIGASLSAAAEGSVTGTFTSAMTNGTIFVDLLHWNQSYSRGWQTTYDSTFNVTEEVTVTLKPYLEFYVEFACKLFDGLIDLSSGVKAVPSFPFVTTAALTQTVNGTTGNVTHPKATSSSSCANGLSEDISFEFDIIAYATQWISVTLYEFKKDIWSGCLNF